MISYTPTYWKGSVLLFNITIKGLYIPRAICSFSNRSERKQRVMINYTPTYWKGSYLLLNIRSIHYALFHFRPVGEAAKCSRDVYKFKCYTEQ